MTRIPYIDNAAGLDGESLHVYEDIKASRGKVIGVFSLLLNSPRVAKLVADLGGYLRFDSPLNTRLKELIIITTLSENSCQFEWSFHEGFALTSGISPQLVEAIKYKKTLNFENKNTSCGIELADYDVLLITYIRELINNKRVSDACFNQFKQQFSTQEITEITSLIGYYCMVACQLNAYELPAEAGKPSLPEPFVNNELARVAEEVN